VHYSEKAGGWQTDFQHGVGAFILGKRFMINVAPANTFSPGIFFQLSKKS